MEPTNKTPNYEKISDMVIVPFRHVFTEEELLQKAFQLAQLNGDIEHEEAEKKATAAEYKNKIDKFKAEAKLVSGHINNKFCMVDRPCELFLDYDTNQRIYMDKMTGDEIRHEPFHAGDYQKKIDFTGISKDTQQQIDENNAAGEFAEGDALDGVINQRKSGKGGDGLKPTPKDNLHPNHGKDLEYEEDRLPEDDDDLFAAEGEDNLPD